ncbi:MAG: hypothetical protein KF830_14825 [Planctomycetes bacterium]|nr:hypothetical protein [Planctomycetota bacterium]
MAWAALAVCGIAQEPAPPDGLSRLVRADAARRLQDADPVLRGEAALVVAEGASPALHDALFAIATDRDQAARGRGLVALGLLASPDGAHLLDGLLADHATRATSDGVAAAFALGLQPPDLVPAVTSRVLTSFLQGSLRRQQPALLALLLGLSRHDDHQQTAALLRLFDDDSVRAPQVRAQLLQLLLRGGHRFDDRRLERLLDRGAAEERLVLLRWLASDGAEAAGLLPALARAARAGDAAVRTEALAALTRQRHASALDLAARALRSSEPQEAAQGLRSVLAVGGAGTRSHLELHLFEETEPARKAALLAAWPAPPSPALVDHAAALATDPGQPAALRHAAATLVARSQPGRAEAMLRDLFRLGKDPATLRQLAGLLACEGGDAVPLDRLLAAPIDLDRHPEHWQALLAAQHPAAIRHLLARLGGPAPAAATALQLWRRVHGLNIPQPAVGDPPAALRERLGD